MDNLFAEFLKSSADLSRIRKFLKNADIPIVTEESQEGKEENTALTLPLRTMDDFESLEESLKNLQIQKLLVRKLGTYGCSDLKRVIHSIMNGLLDPHLAVKISLQGKKGKSSQAQTFSTVLLVSTVFPYSYLYHKNAL